MPGRAVCTAVYALRPGHAVPQIRQDAPAILKTLGGSGRQALAEMRSRASNPAQLRGLARLCFAPAKSGACHVISRRAALWSYRCGIRWGRSGLPLLVGAVQHDYTGGTKLPAKTVCALKLSNLHPPWQVLFFTELSFFKNYLMSQFL